MVFTQCPNIIISSSPFINKYPSVEDKLYVTLALDGQTKACLGGRFSKTLPPVGCQSTLLDPALVPFSVTELIAAHSYDTGCLPSFTFSLTGHWDSSLRTTLHSEYLHAQVLDIVILSKRCWSEFSWRKLFPMRFVLLYFICCQWERMKKRMKRMKKEREKERASFIRI